VTTAMTLGERRSAAQPDRRETGQKQRGAPCSSILHNLTNSLIGADGMTAALVAARINTLILKGEQRRVSISRHYDREIRRQFKKQEAAHPWANRCQPLWCS
jgi:hypothetical protein